MGAAGYLDAVLEMLPLRIRRGYALGLTAIPTRSRVSMVFGELPARDIEQWTI